MNKGNKSDNKKGMSAEERHSEYYATRVLRQIGEMYDCGGIQISSAVDLFDCEEANIRAGQRWAANRVLQKDESIKPAALCNLYADLAWEVLTLRLTPTEWLEWLKPALVAPQRMNFATDVCLGNFGAAYSAIGDYKRAYKFYRKAYKISLESGSAENQAKFLTNIGNVLLLTGRAEEAKDWYLKRLSAAQEIGDPLGVATAHLGLGSVCRSFGEFTDAVTHFENARQIGINYQLRRLLPTCLNNLALTFLDLGDPFSAIPVFEQSLTDAREIGDIRIEAMVLVNLENAKSRFFGKSANKKNFELALALARQINEPRSESAALAGLANYYEKIGNNQKYRDFFGQQLLILQRTGDKSGECTALSEHAERRVKRSEFAEAVELYNRALQIARDFSEPLQEANALLGLGNIYSFLNDFQAAGNFYNQSLEIYRKLNHRGGAAHIALALGNLCLRGQMYREGFDYLNKAVDLFRQIRDLEGEGLSLCGIGNYYFENGESQKALDFFEESLKIFKTASHLHHQATVLNNLGRAQQKLTNYGQALTSFSEAFEIAQKIGNKLLEGVVLINIGENYALNSATADALAYYCQALAILKDLDEPRASFVADRIARLTMKR